MQTILITGSNRGLGLEWVRQYTQLGWRVLATCRFPETAGDLHDLVQHHPNVSIHQLDVTNNGHLAALKKELGDMPIDILLNNAGVYLERDHGSSAHLNYDEWDYTFQVNTMGPVRVTLALQENVANSSKKLVVATTSHMGSITEMGPGSIPYRSSKTALNAAMTNLALSLQPRNVGVLLLHPGPANTRMTPGSSLSVNESVNGMRSIVERFTTAENGRFFRYTGAEIPW